MSSNTLNASAQTQQASPAPHWELSNIYGAETFPLQPASLPPVRTIFDLKGTAMRLEDYRKWTFTVPISTDTPINCHGLPTEQCQPNKTRCSDLYGPFANHHGQYLPLYPVSTLLSRAHPKGNMAIAINVNFFSTFSIKQGKRREGNVYYEQPCSRALGTLISNGHILSDAHSLEGNELKGHALSFDTLAFYPRIPHQEPHLDVIRNLHNGDKTIPLPDTQSLIQNGVTTAVSGFIIAENGQISLENCNGQKQTHCLGLPIARQYPAARTVIGIGDTTQRHPYQMVIAVFQPGRRAVRKTGLYPWEAADYLVSHFHSSTVFMLDGGGSSQFVTTLPPSPPTTSMLACGASMACSLPGDLNPKTGEGVWRPVIGALMISP